MENGKFTLLCTGSGAVGGTVKGSLLSITNSVSAEAMSEVVCYAILSALAAYFTKLALDRLMGMVCKKGGDR